MLTCKNILTFAPCIYFFAAPEICPIGHWSGEGYTNCYQCQPGYTCDEGSTSSTPISEACLPGGYCDGKDRYECPAGTYNSRNTSTSVSDCLPCPPGELLCFWEGGGGVRAKDHSFVGQECQFVSRLLLCWKSGHLKLIL